jgi:hypothetical protein
LRDFNTDGNPPKKDFEGLGDVSALEGSTFRDRLRVFVFLVVCITLVYGMFVVREFNGFDFARYDPGWMVSTVMSIVDDGDLDLRNQLKNDPGQAADQTSLGKDGQWYPLHEFLMPVATIPFYLVFGIYGCLIFNVIISILLMLLIFALCVKYVDSHSAFTATALTAFPTLFLNYTYSYSLDVFSAFLLILAFWYVVRHKFLFAGFVWGLAAFARLAFSITIFGFILYVFLAGCLGTSIKSNERNPRIRSLRLYPVFAYLMGSVPLGICFLLSNWMMFGSPTTTSYDRWQHFVNGKSVVISQRGEFECPFLQNLPKTLLDRKSGLLIGAPLIIVAASFGLGPFWRKARNDAILLMTASSLLIVLFSKYCNAVPGDPGNRYLMPVTALCAIPLSLAISNCFRLDNSQPEQHMTETV